VEHPGRASVRATRGEEGAVHRERGDPHHVSAERSKKASWSVRASARAAAARHLAAEGISDRRSVCPSRGPRGVGLGGLRALVSRRDCAWKSEGAEEATGMSAALSHDQPRGRTTPGGEWIGRERSEDRVVKRGPPRSHLHRAAPSFSVPGPLVTAAFAGGVGWGGRHATRRRAGEHEAQASGRESSNGRRRKATGER